MFTHHRLKIGDRIDIKQISFKSLDLNLRERLWPSDSTHYNVPSQIEQMA